MESEWGFADSRSPGQGRAKAPGQAKGLQSLEQSRECSTQPLREEPMGGDRGHKQPAHRQGQALSRSSGEPAAGHIANCSSGTAQAGPGRKRGAQAATATGQGAASTKWIPYHMHRQGQKAWAPIPLLGTALCHSPRPTPSSIQPASALPIAPRMLTTHQPLTKEMEMTGHRTGTRGLAPAPLPAALQSRAWLSGSRRHGISTGHQDIGHQRHRWHRTARGDAS